MSGIKTNLHDFGAAAKKLMPQIKREEFVNSRVSELMKEGVPPSTAWNRAEQEWKIQKNETYNPKTGNE